MSYHDYNEQGYIHCSKSIVFRIFVHAAQHSDVEPIVPGKFRSFNFRMMFYKKNTKISTYENNPLYGIYTCRNLTIFPHLFSNETHWNWNLCRYGREGAVNVFLCLWEHVVSISVRISATIAQHCRDETCRLLNYKEYIVQVSINYSGGSTLKLLSP